MKTKGPEIRPAAYQAAEQNASRLCNDAVVKFDSPWHIVLFILNIFIPGLGTVISAFMDKDLNMPALIFGII